MNGSLVTTEEAKLRLINLLRMLPDSQDRLDVIGHFCPSCGDSLRIVSGDFVQCMCDMEQDSILTA
jgi:competence CoiA-like predicted nuclease